MKTSDFLEYVQQLPDGKLTFNDIANDNTLLASHDKISVHYIPFGYFPAKAKVALVGITPGFEQMRLGYEAARDLPSPPKSDAELFKRCSAAAGFGGPMRALLVDMLNQSNYPKHYVSKRLMSCLIRQAT